MDSVFLGDTELVPLLLLISLSTPSPQLAAQKACCPNAVHGRHGIGRFLTKCILRSW
jgi:hypothetical protein